MLSLVGLRSVVLAFPGNLLVLYGKLLVYAINTGSYVTVRMLLHTGLSEYWLPDNAIS